MARVAGVRFRKACKVYDFDANGQELSRGDTVIVEVDRGLGMGVVAGEPVETDESSLSYKLKKVIRKADQVDMERQQFNHEREEDAYKICKKKIKDAKLEMKLIRVEYLFDSSKAIFYFTSDGRIDFRVLVKDLASRFHTRIEMRQIGVRDEAKVVGGIGPCGRELCCTNFLSNFAPVTVKMAKEQNLALNPSKISGLCGRLMCCLSYEYRSYQKGAGKGTEAKGKDPSRHGEGSKCGAAGADSASPCQHKDKGDKVENRKNRDERRPRDEKRTEGAGERKPAEDRPAREKRPRRGRRRGGRGRGNRNARVSSSSTDGGQRTDSQRTDNQRTDSQRTDSQRTDSQRTDSQRTDSQRTDSQRTEEKKPGGPGGPGGSNDGGGA